MLKQVSYIETLVTALRKKGPFIFSTGISSSVWSQESIEWLRNSVAGKTLRAFPTRVEASKLVIVDLFVPPPKNPKQKNPVSSSVGKGLPALQFSIAEMMIHVGMAQRIVPAVARGEKSRSTCSSPASVGSVESLIRSISSVSIGSSVQGETCTNNCEVANARDESAGTDNSTSSKDTVIQGPRQVLEKNAESSLEVNKEPLPGRRNSKDDVFREESLKDREVVSANSWSNVEEEDCENSMEQQQVIHNGK